MKVLTAEEMQALDRRAIEELGIPGAVLMENAAIGAVDALAARFADAEDVALVCGPGNNGGDGLAMARHLDGRGYRCRTVLLAARAPGGDAGAQLEILERAGLAVTRLDPDDGVGPLLDAIAGCDLVVDALFGTGLSRPLAGAYAAAVAALDACGLPCLAVDLPSGLDGGKAAIVGPHLRAEVTVTFALPKVAHVLDPAAAACGEVVVADLGLPASLRAQAPSRLRLLEAPALAARLPRRAAGSHKGDYGHALLVAGAPNTAGAAILAARAALRGGAGLLTAAVPVPIRELVVASAPAAMTVALPADDEGALAAPSSALDALLASAEGKAAVALGPGLGTAAGTVETVREAVAALAVPLVLDADGLNAFAGRLETLRERDAATVLTPHPGEMGRLLGVATAAVQEDRLRAVRQAAAASGAVVVLKGRHSLIARPDGRVAVCPTGNPGMATGGSGDVLTGLLAALLAQSLEAAPAAELGVYVHGLAGDLAAETLGEIGLGAEDLITALPAAFERLRGR